jgi:ankyrin repeat protein
MHQSSGLHRACALGDYPLVEIMISGLHVDDMNYEEPRGTTPLTIAAFRGHASICRMLVHSGADIDQITKRGRFPLLEAVRENKFEATKVLLEEGANMYLQNHYKVSPMSVAKRCNFTEILDHMLTIERLRNEHRELFIAISCDDWPTVKQLVGGGEPHQLGHIQLLKDEKPRRRQEAIDNKRAADMYDQQLENMKRRHKESKIFVDEDQQRLREISENMLMIAEERHRWARDAVLAMDGVSVMLRNIRALDVAQVLSLGGNPPPAVKGILKGLCLLRNLKPRRRKVTKEIKNGGSEECIEDDWVGPAYALLTDRSLLRFLRRFDPEKAAQLGEETMFALRDIVLKFPNLQDELADLGQEFKLLNAISVWIQTCLFLVRKEKMDVPLSEGMVTLTNLQEDVTDHLTPYLMQFNYLGKEMGSMTSEAKSLREKADWAKLRYESIDRAIWVSKLLSYRSASRHTALTWSCVRESPSMEITKYLLENGAAIDSNADEEILVAKVIQMVFRHKHWLNTRGGWTPARAQSFRLRELGHNFLLKGALKLLKEERMTSRNALAEAYFNGNYDIANFLMENGARAWKPVYVLPAGHAPHNYPCPPSLLKLLDETEATFDEENKKAGDPDTLETGKKKLKASPSSLLRFVHAHIFDKPKTIVDIAKLGAKLYGRQNFEPEANGWLSRAESRHEMSSKHAYDTIIQRIKDAEDAEKDRQTRIQMRERADLEQRVGRKKLSEAIHSYNFEEVMRLVDEESIAVDMLSFEKYTALGLAASEGTKATNDQGKRVFAVELLLDRPPGKIRPAIDREAYGMTALMWAANNGHLEVLEALVERGANVNHASNDPCPPHILPPRSSFDCETEASAAMVRAEEKRWRSRYKVPEKIDDIEKEYQLSVELVDPDDNDKEEDLQQFGKTPLILATCNNKSDVAWALIQHGADLNARDSTGRSALDWAAVLGRHEILQILTQARINFYGDARGKGLPPSYMPCCYGCGTRLPLKKKEAHEKNECPKRPVPCPQNCLITNLWAEEVESHLSICANRPTPCVLGCGKVMGLLSMPDHIAKDCPHRPVQCEYGCGKELEFRHLVMHLKQWCPERPLECSFKCGVTIPAKDMKEHKRECENRIVRCRNQCGEEMPWNMRREHERTTCPERWVKCKWKDNGCEGCRAKRQQEHEEDECPYRIINCECGETIQERHYREHRKSECQMRVVDCRSSHCIIRFPFSQRDQHEKRECEYRLVKCDHIFVPENTVLKDDDLNPEDGEDIFLRERSLSRNVSKQEDYGMKLKKEENAARKTPSKMKEQVKLVRIHGCGELVRLNTMDDHWRHDCQRKQVPCGNDCGEIILLCNMESHKKYRCKKRFVTCSMGCYKTMREEDREYHETWECKQRQVLCSLGCGFQVSEVRRKLHERGDCPLRFVECSNGCRDTMRFEDLDYHLKEQCTHREYKPPAADWKCSRCGMKNKKIKMLDLFGDDVFAWCCQVCNNKYARRGVKINDMLKSKYAF